MAASDSTVPEPGPDAGIDEVRADIEATRERLGETVGALSEKLDVKARAHDKVVETKAAVVQQGTRIGVPLAAVAAVAALIGLVVWARRR